MSERPNFEQAMARLEEISKLLERGDIPLEQSLEYFEEGTALVKLCRGLLDSAEQKVKILTSGGDGGLGLADFEVADEK